MRIIVYASPAGMGRRKAKVEPSRLQRIAYPTRALSENLAAGYRSL